MPLNSGGGQTLATLAAVALVAGLLLTVVANPAIRAGIVRLWHQVRDNPVRGYLYGPPATPSDTNVAAAVEQPAEPVDDFDYSIFTIQPPPGHDPGV